MCCPPSYGAARTTESQQRPRTHVENSVQLFDVGNTLSLGESQEPANEAAAHIGEYATVEGVVARVFTSKGRNTFLNYWCRVPKLDVCGMDLAGIASERPEQSSCRGVQSRTSHSCGRLGGAAKTESRRMLEDVYWVSVG